MTFYDLMLAGLWDLLKAPFVDFSALWVITPLFLLWFIIEIYFDVHNDETIGWNTALGNGITMFWISVQLMRHIFINNFDNFSFSKLAIIAAILIYSIFISYISFTHRLSKTITFYIASPTAVYYWSGIAILWAYGAFVSGIWIFLDMLILFGLLLILVFFLRKYSPFHNNY